METATETQNIRKANISNKIDIASGNSKTTERVQIKRKRSE